MLSFTPTAGRRKQPRLFFACAKLTLPEGHCAAWRGSCQRQRRRPRAAVRSARSNAREANNDATAKRSDRSIDLLPREFRLLEHMMRRNGRYLAVSAPPGRGGRTSSFQRPTSWECIWAGFGARSMGRMRRL